MNDKEQEYKMYRDYIESIYGNAYLTAIAKLGVPLEYQYNPDGRLRTELYLSENEKNALMYAYPYLAHMENDDSFGSRKF